MFLAVCEASEQQLLRLSREAQTELSVTKQRGEQQLASQEALLAKAAKSRELWAQRAEAGEEKAQSLRRRAMEVGVKRSFLF